MLRCLLPLQRRRVARSTFSTFSNCSYSSSRGVSRLKDESKQGRLKLTLEHFVLRSKSIQLYRDFIRASRNIPNPEARRQTIEWLRDEHFEGQTGLKYEYDVIRIKELLVYGNVALKRICGPMELAAAVNPRHGTFPKLRGPRQI